MSGDGSGGGGSATLRDAVNPDVRADEPLAAYQLKLAKEGSALDIARQAFVDRACMLPVECPPRVRFSNELALKRWRAGAEVPPELRDEFAGWLENNTARRLAFGENERRLRSTLLAQTRLAASTLADDRRRADAFGRWHREHWRIIDIAALGELGKDSPLERQLLSAVSRHCR